jgi:2,3-dihydroxybiphenyl 1,2-dioxygenase
MSVNHEDLFGSSHLGYLVVETNRLADWRRFGIDAVGMQGDEPKSGVLRFRLDENRCRFLLQRGPAEDVTAVGWHLDSHEALDAVVRRVKERGGPPVVEGGEDEAALRGVERLVRFTGPKGLVHEVFTRPIADARAAGESVTGAFVTPAFVTGEGGFGHIALTTRQPEKLHAYYRALFDARLSDFIDETIAGVRLKIRFLRVNARHHSVALAATRGVRIDPIRTRIQHVNVQAAELDSMVASYLRMKDLGFRIAQTIGQHTNDRELSYYVRTPSGFEWEVGWNPIVVDESTWNPMTHHGISLWGHTPVGQGVIDRLGQFAHAARSLAHTEN